MKGRWATGKAEASEFVIVNPSNYVWTAPRGRFAKWTGGWDLSLRNAEIYKSWESADKAIDRYRAKGRIDFTNAKYCTVKELKEIRAAEGERIY